MRTIFIPMLLSLLLSVCAFPVMAHENHPPIDFLVEPHQVVKVYDGDTFYINLPFLPEVFGKELPIRARTYDTPELRSRCETEEQKERERTLGRAARDRTIEILSEASKIRLVEPERGSFFRVVATIVVDGKLLGSTLIEEGLAIAYEDRYSGVWCELPE